MKKFSVRALPAVIALSMVGLVVAAASSTTVVQTHAPLVPVVAGYAPKFKVPSTCSGSVMASKIVVVQNGVTFKPVDMLVIKIKGLLNTGYDDGAAVSFDIDGVALAQTANLENGTVSYRLDSSMYKKLAIPPVGKLPGTIANVTCKGHKVLTGVFVPTTTTTK